MQIKTTMRYHYISITKAKIEKIVKTPNVSKDAWKQNHSYLAGENVKQYSHYFM